MWLFALPWDIRGAGGVNQVVQNLIRLTRHAPSASPLLLVRDHAAVPATATRCDGTAVIRTWIPAPWHEPVSLRRMLALLVHWPVSFWRLTKLLRRAAPAGVNAHYPGLWCLTLLLAARVARPSAAFVLSFHGADVTAIERSGRVSRYLWRSLIRRADAVTCCSHDLRARLVAAAGSSADETATVHNGVDVAHLEVSARQGRMPGYLEGKRFLLNIGTYEEKKGQDLLIRAFASLAHRDEDLHLAIAGRAGPSLPTLRALIADLGLQQRVHLEIDMAHADVLAMLSRAEAFVLSSRQEPFGIVLLEAAHFGVPIVAAAVGGVPEVVAHEETALLVPPDDPAALEAAIRRVLGDVGLRERLTTQAKAAVLERFTWEAALEKYRSHALSGRRSR